MLKRKLTTLVLVAAIAYTGYGFACSKANLTAYARDVVSALNDTLPILTNAGIGTEKVRKAIEIGNQLVTAFQNGQNDDALNFTSKLITAFEEIANDAALIPNEQTRKRVIVILAIGNIALHYIANHLPAAESTGAIRPAAPGTARATDLNTVREFAKKPVWKCRSSQTGRFMKMDYCKAHPDVSTVERF